MSGIAPNEMRSHLNKCQKVRLSHSLTLTLKPLTSTTLTLPLLVRNMDKKGPPNFSQRGKNSRAKPNPKNNNNRNANRKVKIV